MNLGTNRLVVTLDISTAFAVLPKLHLFPIGEEDGRDQSKLETKVWEAHNPLVDKQIDQFLVVAR